MKVLCLYESNLPKWFDEKTLSPGEARVIAAVPEVQEVHLIGRDGQMFYELQEKGKRGVIEKKIHIHRIPFSGPHLLYYVSGLMLFVYTLFFLLKHKDISVIHAESPHISGPAAILLGKLFHIPVIVEYRASYEQLFNFKFTALFVILLKIYRTVSSWVFSNAHYIMANSSLYADEIKRLGLEKVDWYNPGVTPPRAITPKTNQSKLIQIGYMGRLYLDKGPQLFLESLKNLDLHLLQQIKVSVAGSGPAMPVLKQMVEESDLEETVSFLGTQDRWKFLSQIDILVNPNPAEPALDMVNIEAAAVGVPVICFGDAERPVTVLHKKTGIKVPHRDTQKIAEAIEKLIKDSILRNKLGSYARSWYAKDFSFESQVIRLRNTYQAMTLLD